MTKLKQSFRTTDGSCTIFEMDNGEWFILKGVIKKLYLGHVESNQKYHFDRYILDLPNSLLCKTYTGEMCPPITIISAELPIEVCSEQDQLAIMDSFKVSQYFSTKLPIEVCSEQDQLATMDSFKVSQYFPTKLPIEVCSEQNHITIINPFKVNLC